MSMTKAVARPVLADLIPGTWARDIALVVAGTVLLTVAGQISIPLWFTPVPLSLATFAVLFSGVSLGPVRAAASVLLYIGLGVAGAPMFADQGSGWAFASFGYILGYLPAAIVAGLLARRAADRSLIATIGMAALSTLIVYAGGVPWLMAFLGIGFGKAFALGVAPFLIGDAIKAVAAAVALPLTWKAIGFFKSRR